MKILAVVLSIALCAGCASSVTTSLAGGTGDHAQLIARQPSIASLAELSHVPRPSSDLVDELLRRLGCTQVSPLSTTHKVCIDSREEGEQVMIQTGLTRAAIEDMKLGPGNRGALMVGYAPPDDYWAAGCSDCAPTRLKPLGGHLVVRH